MSLIKSIFVHGSRTGHGTAETLRFETPRTDEASITLMVDVDDVDLHYENARRAGADTLLDVETYEFGERQYSVRDLEPCGQSRSPSTMSTRSDGAPTVREG